MFFLKQLNIQRQMKKLLIQPCVLMVASLGLLLTACGGDEQAGGVTVIGEPTVSIEFVGTPGVSDVTVKFVPTEETAKFNYAIGSEQDRENFENGDIVGMQTETSNQEITHTWKDLEAGEYYVVYAMAYDEDGAAGPVSAHGFKTASSDFVVETYYIGDNSPLENRYYIGKGFNKGLHHGIDRPDIEGAEHVNLVLRGDNFRIACLIDRQFEREVIESAFLAFTGYPLSIDHSSTQKGLIERLLKRESTERSEYHEKINIIHFRQRHKGR